MARYIDADEFVKRVIQYPRQSTKSIGLALADTPTADVVEVKDIEAECELAYKHGWSDCFAEHRWIPVTERLPEEQQIVATYQKWGEYKLNHIIDGTEWYWDGVVAWMPIEPYREEATDAQLD